MNKVIWNKRALKEVREFPEEIRKEIGYLLYVLQVGELIDMPHSRPMPTLGSGAHELRVKGEDGIYRVFYFLKVKNQILVFHAFKKKSQKTLTLDLELGRKNLKEMLYEKEK